MKVISLGDLHVRGDRPVGRVDDFTGAMWRKLTFMVSYCNDNGIDAMLLPGDIFDSVNAGSKLLVRLALILQEYEGKIFIVYGNHDLRNHNMKTCEDTPLGLLKDLVPNMHVAGSDPIKYKGCLIYGASWNESIPTPEEGSKSILLIHKMIIDKKLWPAQKVDNSGKGIQLLRDTDYTLISSGDNHQQFVLGTGDKRWLINSGSMMRTTIRQINATPGFFVFNTKTCAKPKLVAFDISLDSFDLEKLEEQENVHNTITEFSSFIEVLSKGRESEGISFKRVYRKILKRTNDAELIEYSNDIFSEV